MNNLPPLVWHWYDVLSIAVALVVVLFLILTNESRDDDKK
jgi:hypothetical protein